MHEIYVYQFFNFFAILIRQEHKNTKYNISGKFIKCKKSIIF